MARAAELLESVPLFDGFQLDERHRLLQRVRVESVAANRVVIRQGARADRFYFIVEGSAEVRFRSRGGGERLLARLGPGDYFGEIALLRDGRRTATVIARGGLLLLSLDRRRFREIVAPRLDAMQAAGRAIKGRAILAQFPLFQPLTLRELDLLLSRLGSISVAAGETVIHQGDVGDRFYLVTSGSARVLRSEQGVDVELGRLGPGEYFGEIALFYDVPRTASVVAVTDLELLTLERDDFHDLLGQYLGLEQSLSRIGLERCRDATERLAGLVDAR